MCHGIEVGLIPDVGKPLESFPLLHQELSPTAAPGFEYEEAAGQERAMSVVDVDAVPSIYSSARTELAKLLIYGLFRKIRVLAQDGMTRRQ